MQNLANRIKAVRKKLGINQQELADILGCSDGKVKGWEQGNTKTIKAKDSIILADKFGFSREWLEDGEGEMMQNKSNLLIDEINETVALLNSNTIIPYYKNIQASAGNGCTNSDCKSTNITLAKDMLPTLSDKIEAIKVSGNSMHPTIDDDNVIFIDKNITTPQDGKIFVVFLCNEVYVKRIFIEPKTKEIILNSDNPLFPQLKADCDDFRIIGKVIATMKIDKL